MKISFGLVAMAATAGLAASTEKATPFVEALWDARIPTGQWRYYDGLLYLMGLLYTSGNFQIYTPGQ
jgi:oligosaccharide reducing-end xylanase